MPWCRTSSLVAGWPSTSARGATSGSPLSPLGLPHGLRKPSLDRRTAIGVAPERRPLRRDLDVRQHRLDRVHHVLQPHGGDLVHGQHLVGADVVDRRAVRAHRVPGQPGVPRHARNPARRTAADQHERGAGRQYAGDHLRGAVGDPLHRVEEGAVYIGSYELWSVHDSHLPWAGSATVPIVSYPPQGYPPGGYQPVRAAATRLRPVPPAAEQRAGLRGGAGVRAVWRPRAPDRDHRLERHLGQPGHDRRADRPRVQRRPDRQRRLRDLGDHVGRVHRR